MKTIEDWFWILLLVLRHTEESCGFGAHEEESSWFVASVQWTGSPGSGSSLFDLKLPCFSMWMKWIWRLVFTDYHGNTSQTHSDALALRFRGIVLFALMSLTVLLRETLRIISYVAAAPAVPVEFQGFLRGGDERASLICSHGRVSLSLAHKWHLETWNRIWSIKCLPASSFLWSVLPLVTVYLWFIWWFIYYSWRHFP